MADYYRSLGIEPSATIEEINAVIDEKINEKLYEVRSQSDQKIIGKLNHEIENLEQIREVLTKNTKQTLVGGVSDLERPSGIAFTPAKFPNEASSDVSLDRWICSNGNCGIANPVGARFCQACNTLIGIVCPNPSCGRIVKKDVSFCMHCGVDIKQGIKERRRQIEQLWQSRQRGEIDSYDAKIEDVHLRIRDLEKNPPEANSGCLSSKIAWSIGLYFLLGSINVLIYFPNRELPPPPLTLATCATSIVLAFLISSVIKGVASRSAAGDMQENLRPQINILEDSKRRIATLTFNNSSEYAEIKRNGWES
jgi:hypothetical protein